MKKCSVGGQAVIEGVMMKNADRLAVAVRKSDGEIELEKRNISSWIKRKGVDKLPFLRGVFVLLDSMVEGIKALNFSAEFFEDEEDGSEPGKIDKFIENMFGDKASDVMIYVSVAISIVLTVLLFIMLPTFIGGLLKNATDNVVLLNLSEGLLRVCIFAGYVYAISFNEDIRRVYEYHGAEHKSIHCYESGQELTPENAAKFTTIHPRCGTNFMFVVLIISMLLFSLFGWPSPLERVLYRLILLPVVSGISYEIIRLAGKYDTPLLKPLIWPGLMMQKITTREPDISQLEVAISALKAVVETEEIAGESEDMIVDTAGEILEN
ncbi:Uncharacterized conserved protein YqhQ [Peptoclostridium litorale DSM 5388]|uniref:DUF1385 domain-containing protein n=1 Tax=Peptoclostridium litorale DSM 5388 TaxID=1121324 RepID=A0A069RCL4_PEPLI|nr:DUF1385 domain-containing protein [Peptoclostridium litorale]KDR94799.1 hypothetical protein CLIT_13c01210 [Peptoclostridium litorale DSM 5388]SIN92945.1 Uncharacterized conserved protein YqhQ [Peptoclostridium litorale DSM 5388]